MKKPLSYCRALARNKYFWIIFAITALGILFRAYQHENLLFFEVDQARDWRFVEIALKNGPGELPLLGSGMNLSSYRLGPIFNYIQYLFALFFGASPEKMAYPDLFFSVLSIPLLYFFLKEYFSKTVSSLLTAIYSCSLFVIEYSRFGWNTNSIPFFVLLNFYSLLRFSREKNEQKKWLWIGLVAFSFGILLQLHALTFVALPVITVFYFIATKTKINIKQFFFGASIIFILLLPMFLNDTISNFQNTKALFSGLSGRQDAQKEFSLPKRVAKETHETIRNYTTILASKPLVGGLDQMMRKEGALDMLKRNLKGTSNQINLLFSLVLFAFFVFPIYLLAKRIFNKKEKSATERSAKNFIILVLSWQILLWLICCAVTYVNHTRYYLPVIFVPFVMLGVYLEKIMSREKWGKKTVFFLATILFIFNLYQVKQWFILIQSYSTQSNFSKKTRTQEQVLDPYFIVTYNQMEGIMEYIREIYKSNGKDMVLASPDQFYGRSIRYVLHYEENIPIAAANAYRDDTIQYLYLEPSENPQKTFEDLRSQGYKNDFTATDYKSFGTLSIFSLQLKDGVRIKREPKNSYDEPENGNLSKKYTWNQFFNHLKK